MNARAADLLRLVEAFHAETHPGRAERTVGLDASLERDLGFDSLARSELLLRIEREFGVQLPEETLGAAETPGDLLDALDHAAGGAAGFRTERESSPEGQPGDPAPASVATLTAALEWHATTHPERTHIVHVKGSGEEETTSYGQLWQRARAVAAGLQARDLEPGDSVALMLPTGPEFFSSFFGILLAGGVPVPIYPPARISQVEDHLRRHAAILENAVARFLVTTAEAAVPARLLRGQVECLRDVLMASELAATAGSPVHVPVRVPVHAGDLALLQYTSGSTGIPKGVMLTHANLLANIRAMGSAAGVTPADVFVSWLPLYHDMGLICAWLSSLVYAVRFVSMSPLTFLAGPDRWLWAIHRHRGTLSGAPNFAYELCLHRMDAGRSEGLDLSSWRLAFSGAEPVIPETLERFAERYAARGLRREALAPVYGLAECAVGLAFTPGTPGRSPRIERIRRETFVATGQAVPAGPEETDALRLAVCGRPLPGHEMRVVDAAGRELPERREGRLEFRGPSATAGYFRNPEATKKLFHGEWLDSGDYAYLAEGEVVLTGRAKDVIIKGGRNLYPQEIEAAVGRIPGIRKGCVAAFGSPDPASGTERLVVVAETRESDAEALARLRAAVVRAVVDAVGIPPDEVVLSSERIVLKTSSGKVRRAASRELFEQGGVSAPRAVWLQLLRLTLAGLLPELRRGLRAAGAGLYGAWAWLVFWLVCPPTWALVSALPRPIWSWAVGRLGARLFLLLAGIRVAVEGLEKLPEDSPCVIAANHASYLDGLFLVAALPPGRFRFVAKRELLDSFVSRLFLRGLGSEFVERFDFQQGVADAARLGEAVAAGDSPFFFAEGTFSRVPGIAAFRMGAFVVAAQNGVPLVPVAIRGARAILRDGHWMPRYGEVAITVGEPRVPEGDDWVAAVRLRDAARAEILKHCGEPDLLA